MCGGGWDGLGVKGGRGVEEEVEGGVEFVGGEQTRVS